MSRRLRAAASLATAAIALAAAAPVGAGLLPVAVPDSYSAVHDRVRTVADPGVLGNDLQLGSGFSAMLVADVNRGELDLDADGGFTYRPDAGYGGTDTFRYRVDGGLLGLSNTATVTIAITNERPAAEADSYTVSFEGERVVGAPGVLGNDDDGDGDDLAVDVVAGPADGSLTAAADGSFRYRPDDGFSGTDTWRYRVSDGIEWSNTVAVTMKVTAPPSTPAPTPTPTPRPTATPLVPLPTLPPVPTVPPVDGPGPTPSATPTQRPTAAPASERPTASPTPSSRRGLGDPAGGGSGGAPGGPPGSDGGRPAPSAVPTDGARPESGGPFMVSAAAAGGGIELDASFATFDGFEWAVPVLVMTVPGILIVIAVVIQALIGLAWLPVTRRWLDGDRRRAPRVVIAEGPRPAASRAGDHAPARFFRGARSSCPERSGHAKPAHGS